ncbi:ribosome-associated translation inhibitor RaiA [Ferrovibrio terrae]|jgi:ribosomal subunit interface protein|uniref:Ribosome hibernation promoting factor n=1 Tax=Ferrovibrio terrae TaxID=2594003 RepID=A0A516H2T7_9PROT|nr:ribosome-associated translation inhibitor RaiA [Ferrovibrio terrae]QDO98079.1 ribosome-associated translation inhibitor RaiA [Ferrovibrio terrae]
MKILTSGQQLDLGDSLRAYVEEHLTAAVSKYMDNAIEANVVFRLDGSMYHCQCTVHIGAGISMQAAAEGNDIYVSFDQALDKLAKQVRRDKRKRRNHHQRPTETGDAA